MFAGVLVALTPPRSTAPARPAAGDAKGQGDSQSQGRGEQWDNRPDDRDE
jgi:hypothetical protein